MPLREINAIEEGLDMYINYSMKNAYDLDRGDVLIMEVRRHFDENKELLNDINEVFEVELTNPRWINLQRDLPGLVQKYGIKSNHYIEVVYTEMRREGESMEIFPGENKEYLDFDPDREEYL
jgi:hypothetical protein